MRNLYQQSEILSKDEFEKIEKALEKSWNEDTATFADISKTWSNDNPAYGQCMVSAIIINDLFGGKLVYDRNNHHYWNLISDGTQQDFTRIQFKKGVDFVVTKYKTKDEVLSDDYAIKHKAIERYGLLKQKFQEAYNNI